MKQTSTPISFPIHIAPGAAESRRDALCVFFRKAIQEDRLKPGARIPSSREMHQLVGLARTSVVEAYEQLIAEGYFESRHGSGTFVASALPDGFFHAIKPGREPGPKTGKGSWPQSKRAKEVVKEGPDEVPGAGSVKPFRYGTGALDLFSANKWAALTARRWKKVSLAQLGYADIRGVQPLREAIAEHVSHTRGGTVSPEDIFVTSGSQQAVKLVGELILNPGDRAYIEDPGYLGARNAILGAGATPIPLPIDREGVILPPNRHSDPKAKLIFVTPSFQFPLGIEMSLARRIALLEWAKKHRCVVLEDDYDCEFRFEGRPVQSLYALDRGENTVYCSTFSKSLAPALRLGFVIIPPQHHESAGALLRLMGHGPPTIDQLVFADFLGEGYFTRHVRMMQTLLAERQEIFLHEAKILSKWCELARSKNGLHILGLLRGNLNDRQIAIEGRKLGLQLTSLSPMYLERARRQHGYLFGFGAFRRDQVRRGLVQLRELLKRAKDSGTPVQ